MFERYTEKARRVIFFARYEASAFGSPYIETEHILLGVLREDKAFISKVLPSVSFESIRKNVEAHAVAREPIPTSVDLPLSNECKRVLAYASEEAERLGHKHIGSEHLLLGLLREEKSFAAAMLDERGVSLKDMRKEVEAMPIVNQTPASTRAAAQGPASIGDFSRDLTQAAMEGRLDPLIGREAEQEALMTILCRCFHRSVLLIGERGAGKSALVDGLAQRIAEGLVPQPLVDKRVTVIDGEVVAGWALSGPRSDERLNHAVRAMIEASDAIFFISDLERLIAAGAASRTAVINGILKHWLLRGRLVCIAACTPAEYAQLIQSAPWVRDCFTEVHVRPLDDAATRQVLESRKHHYESFHQVVYAADALDLAIGSAARYLPHKPLPGKAFELLDAAGAYVRSREGTLPLEIAESMKKLSVLRGRVQKAEDNHEFEKARFYLEEQGKEAENLESLRAKHGVTSTTSYTTVTGKHLEDVIAQWSSFPFRA
jgi:ATP-dependent Clp protease ATP-binding subunit ClpC